MFGTWFLVLVSCCHVFCGITRTTEEIWPQANDDNDFPIRIQRGILITASELFRVKQITETILSNARAIKQATGEQPWAYLTEYEKHGGPKQAYKDFKLFRAQERQDFLLPGGGEGKWAMVGDTSILLERSKDRTILMVKQGTGTANEHVDRIIYKN